ncbi:TPA: hypothetical protein DEP96_01135 [Candidatus Uhrbacteria bacterium]|nr:hypothetical protein [Candidatus Uhrbacteria bacterium]
MKKAESPIHREGAERMRAERLKAEEPESMEARAGKERLQELVERSDVDADTITRLAIYLECEPWEAVARLEKQTTKFDKLIETHRKQYIAEKDGRSQFNLLSSYIGDELGLVLREADSLDLLDWQHDPILLAKDVASNVKTSDLELRRIRQINYGVTPDKNVIDIDRANEGVIDMWSLAKNHTNSKPWFSVSWDESNLKIFPVMLRRDFWTIGRELVMALPKEFGYKDAKEADMIITAQVEKIGRAFSQDMKKIDGAFYVGPKTEKQEKLRELDKKVAQEIILKYKQVLENKRLEELAAKNEIRRADRAYKAERHELLARLHEIEKQLGLAVNLPAVRETTGPINWFNKKMESLAQMVSAKARYQKQLVDEQRKALWAERLLIANKLTKQNNEALRDNRKLVLGDAPRSSSRYSGAFEELGVDVDYWSKKADEEIVKIVDEDLVQEQLDELKRK